MGPSFRLLLTLVGFGEEVAVRTVREAWERVSREGRLRRQLERLEASGRVEIAGEGPLDQRLIRITAGARQSMLGGVDPEAAWKRPWDGAWRIVAFDVPETRLALRTRLRRRLHDARFGWLQNSVWIHPHPVDEFRQQLGDTGIAPESLVCFDAHPSGGESPAAVVDGAWDFTRLAKDYDAYMKLLRLHPRGGSGALGAWFRWLEQENQAWLKVARHDPFLPEVLLPRSYTGREAWELRRQVFRTFAKALSENHA